MKGRNMNNLFNVKDLMQVTDERTARGMIIQMKRLVPHHMVQIITDTIWKGTKTKQSISMTHFDLDDALAFYEGRKPIPHTEAIRKARQKKSKYIKQIIKQRRIDEVFRNN
jgi:hypothetical protein